MTPRRWFLLGLFLRFVVVEALCLVLSYELNEVLPMIPGLLERVVR